MYIIGNGRLYTGSREGKLIEDGAVLVSGEKILEVGTTSSLKEKYPKAEYVDAEGKLIMPGFINTHEHIYSAFARGLNIPGNVPKNFLDVLEGTWWKIDRHLNVQQSYYSAIATYIECIKNGVTFVSDHHASYGEITGSLMSIYEAAKLLGVRTCLCYEVSDRDGSEKMQEAVDENTSFINFVNEQNSNMIKGLFGLHASFTLSDKTLELCREKNTSNAGYHVHIAEGEYDELECMKHHGMTVVKRLHKEGILGPKSVAGHCIHVTEGDMDILEETKTTVIHNPESNMGNAVGAPDVIKMLDKGIRVGLGTDGYTHDMLESLKVANILQKHRRQLPDRGFGEALQCLNNNAAIASDIVGERVGNIEEGALADIIIMDYKPNTPFTGENFGGHLMFGMSGAMVDTTIINGKIVMRHRILTSVDEEKLLSDCRQSAQSLWDSIMM